MWWWRAMTYTTRQEYLAQWGAACGGILATVPSAKEGPLMRPFYVGVGAVAGGGIGYLYRFVVPAAVSYVVYRRLSARSRV